MSGLTDRNAQRQRRRIESALRRLPWRDRMAVRCGLLVDSILDASIRALRWAERKVDR